MSLIVLEDLLDYLPTSKEFVGSVVIIAAASYLLVKPLFRVHRGTSLKSVQKKNWQYDRVYLYQLPRSPFTPNLSPFCLKIETFLRVHKIDYETISGYFMRSKNGHIPFIELNGEQIADSQFIIERLKQHFSIKEEETGTMRAFDRLADNSLFCSITWTKGYKEAWKCYHPKTLGMTGVPSFLHGLVAWILSGRVKETLGQRIRTALGNLSDEQIDESLRADLAAFEAQLGKKPFLFGDTITATDCSFFAQLGCAVDLPFPQPLTKILRSERPKLMAYIDRVKHVVYPNWPRVD